MRVRGDSPRARSLETPPHANPRSASSCSRGPASGERERTSRTAPSEPHLIAREATSEPIGSRSSGGGTSDIVGLDQPAGAQWRSLLMVERGHGTRQIASPKRESAVRRDDLVSQTSSHQRLRVRRSREAQPQLVMAYAAVKSKVQPVAQARCTPCAANAERSVKSCGRLTKQGGSESAANDRRTLQ